MRLVAIVALACAACGRIAFDPLVDAQPSSDVLTGSPSRVDVYELTPAATTTDVPIADIDPSRTIVMCDFRTNNSSVGRQPACALTSSTTLQIRVPIVEPSLVVRAQIVQLPIGTTVQRGHRSVGSGLLADDVSIAAIDPSRAFPLFSRTVNLDATGFDERMNVTATFPDPQTLHFERLASGNTLEIDWQVIEMPTATVTAGMASLAPGTSTQSLSDAPFDRAHFFIVPTIRTTGSNEDEYLVQVNLDIAGQIIFTRAGTTNTTEIAYYIVETPAVTSQHGVTWLMGFNGLGVGIAAPIDPSRTAALVSYSGGRAGNMADVEQVASTVEVMQQSAMVVRGANPPIDTNTRVSFSLLQWNP